MGNVPVLKPSEVIAILIALGFTEVRQRGSHKQFRDPLGRCTTVPFHQGRDISPILLRQIAKDIGLTVVEFLRNRQVQIYGQPDLRKNAAQVGCLCVDAAQSPRRYNPCRVTGPPAMPWLGRWRRASLALRRAARRGCAVLGVKRACLSRRRVCAFASLREHRKAAGAQRRPPK